MPSRPDATASFPAPMDAPLKLLADASLAVAAAEDALGDAAHHAAVEHLDAADAGLALLRAEWPAMSAPQRAVVGPSAAAVRSRADAARARVPRLSALSVGAPVSDPEEDAEPPE
jgi:hypothetical protein